MIPVIFTKIQGKTKLANILMFVSLFLVSFAMVYQINSLTTNLMIYYVIWIITNIIVIYFSKKKTTTFLGEKINWIMYVEILTSLPQLLWFSWKNKKK